MPLHLSRRQYLLMWPFLVSMLPLSLFWFGYGMEGELSIPGLIVLLIFYTVAILIAGSAQVVEPEDGEKSPNAVVPALEVGGLLAPDSPWLAGWLSTAVVIGIIFISSRDTAISAVLKGIVFGGHVLWTSLVFWWFRHHPRIGKKSENGISRRSFHRRHY
jgi:hypothetical protein